MIYRLSLLTLLGLGACSFRTDGVELGGIDASGAPDACVPTTETCDGSDEDCDGTTDEGFASGDPCDGPDADLCPDDMMVCGDGGGGEVCGDTSGDDNLELCNGPDLDEDCDGATDEGYVLGACDGGDTDMCTEGTATCAPDGLGVVCGDATGNSVETCDGTDQDCIGGIDNGFDLQNDESNCGQCEQTCAQTNSTNTCMTGTCTPVCNNGAAQCNGNVDDGCELVRTMPLCANTPVNPDADVNGDPPVGGGDAETAILTGTTERFMRIRLRESNFAGSQAAITASLTLVSGTGTDFDLYVYCTANCDIPPLISINDTIHVGRADAAMQDRTFDVIAEVRYDPTTPSTTCAQWTLTIVGNAGASVLCGPP